MESACTPPTLDGVIEKVEELPQCGIRFYCDTCEVVICHECTALSHARPEHVFRQLDDVTTESRSILETLGEKIKVNGKEAETSRFATQQMLDAVTLCTDQEEQKIKEHVRVMIEKQTERIRCMGETLLKALAKESKDRRNCLQTQLRDLDEIQNDLKNAGTLTTNLMPYAHSVHFLPSRKGILTELERVLNFESNQSPFYTEGSHQYPNHVLANIQLQGSLGNYAVT
ncbi:E3 ubiquitin-protein ligase TRIM33-like [Glandiceps talaboti]